jgi:hypothetical protein
VKVWPPHPAHLDPYVEELGHDLAVRFFEELGGVSLYWTQTPKGRSRAEALIGADRLAALSERLEHQRGRVPRPAHWLAHVYRARGYSIAEMCPKLGRTDTAVARLLARPLPQRRLPSAPISDGQDDEDQMQFRF